MVWGRKYQYTLFVRFQIDADSLEGNFSMYFKGKNTHNMWTCGSMGGNLFFKCTSVQNCIKKATHYDLIDCNKRPERPTWPSVGMAKKLFILVHPYNKKLFGLWK